MIILVVRADTLVPRHAAASVPALRVFAGFQCYPKTFQLVVISLLFNCLHHTLTVRFNACLFHKEFIARSYVSMYVCHIASGNGLVPNADVLP